ncbi:hypothetical protein ABID94_003230 [Streptomyces sp. PvR018]
MSSKRRNTLSRNSTDLRSVTQAGRGWHRQQITIWIPPALRATGVGATGGAAWVGYAILNGTLDRHSVWPAIFLLGMSMMYDLGRRILDRF